MSLTIRGAPIDQLQYIYIYIFQVPPSLAHPGDRSTCSPHLGPGEDGAKRHVFQDSADKEAPETPETPAAPAAEEGPEVEAHRGCATGFLWCLDGW